MWERRGRWGEAGEETKMGREVRCKRRERGIGEVGCKRRERGGG